MYNYKFTFELTNMALLKLQFRFLDVYGMEGGEEEKDNLCAEFMKVIESLGLNEKFNEYLSYQASESIRLCGRI